MNHINHALVLNLHQPAGNFELLEATQPWEVREILFAIDRIPRSLWKYEHGHAIHPGMARGKVHLSMSGTLLETLASPTFQNKVYGLVDCGSLLWHLQNENIIRILGGGYYHPVLPLIPPADRKEHLLRWLGIARHLFSRPHFPGFWPAEMGFSMELIPLLSELGYRYVLVDSKHVQPVDPMSWEELRYRPHIARHGDHSITVIVRDRELSDAQESGMEYEWFSHEVHARTRHCNFEPLVTTCTDGDNGGWFRDTSIHNNFWTSFYSEYMHKLDAADDNIRPVFIEDYLDEHGVSGEVHVQTGAWNTGWHDGKDFIQWTGSLAQQQALQRVSELSQRVHEARWFAGLHHEQDEAVWAHLEQAMWRLLRAETSCNFFWGEAWIPRVHNDLDEVERVLG